MVKKPFNLGNFIFITWLQAKCSSWLYVQAEIELPKIGWKNLYNSGSKNTHVFDLYDQKLRKSLHCNCGDKITYFFMPSAYRPDQNDECVARIRCLSRSHQLCLCLSYAGLLKLTALKFNGRHLNAHSKTLNNSE